MVWLTLTRSAPPCVPTTPAFLSVSLSPFRVLCVQVKPSKTSVSIWFMFIWYWLSFRQHSTVHTHQHTEIIFSSVLIKCVCQGKIMGQLPSVYPQKEKGVQSWVAWVSIA